MSLLKYWDKVNYHKSEYKTDDMFTALFHLDIITLLQADEAYDMTAKYAHQIRREVWREQ